MMDIFIIFGLVEEDYPGQYLPEPIVIGGHEIYDENPEFMKDQLELAREEYPNAEVIKITLSEEDVRKIRRHLLRIPPAISGTIEAPE